MLPTCTSALEERLARCSDAVRPWFIRNHLDADKSDVTTLGTAAQLRSVAAVTTVDVAGSSLSVVKVVM